MEIKQSTDMPALPKKSLFSHQAAWIKPVIIFIMMLILLIPLAFIRSLVNDREEYRRTAEASIMEPAGGEPVIEGLVLAVPYDELIEYTDDSGKVVQKGKKQDYILTVPETYNLVTQINPYHLSRGIFTVPIFNGDLAIKASFSGFQFSQFNIAEKNIRYKDAVLILGIKDKKTLTAYPALRVNGMPLIEALTAPAGASPFRNAVYYMMPEDTVRSGFSIEGSVSIQGGKSLCIVPLAADNSFAVQSTWPAPSFSGGWLPKNRTLDDSGFSADWHISGLSTAFPRSWKAQDFDIAEDTDVYDEYGGYAAKAVAEPRSSPETVKIGFITPVNHYSQVKRCITYALLFLAVPFLAIFLCELWSAVRIHPIQYFLIGIADVLFYLLLLSFSEHISFSLSYLIATAGVCTVVGFYTAAIFKRIRWGILLTAVQAISYLLLFGILQSEDYALLIGSIGIFCVVALLMFLTRRVDWYSTRFISVHTHSEGADGDITRMLTNDESFSGGAQ
ncbi:cell envelope integrity protein CreD [Treponema sp. OMZ 305]|uniref:cell envelope integrity protein CreD n=1 Tax=unclassified Treponema TaxID=2638727 RepID=UPI0020A4194F|nr:cell envelope integrity protein CreD [Treponema sp. OMZ 305]UTC56987.1 cell envelope integrity protein CreD [Treponema sp. OMZ 305]